MSLEHYNALELAYVNLQYLSYARVHPIERETYLSEVYLQSDMHTQFQKQWGWMKYLGLESVVDGE